MKKKKYETHVHSHKNINNPCESLRVKENNVGVEKGVLVFKITF